MPISSVPSWNTPACLGISSSAIWSSWLRSSSRTLRSMTFRRLLCSTFTSPTCTHILMITGAWRVCFIYDIWYNRATPDKVRIRFAKTKRHGLQISGRMKLRHKPFERRQQTMSEKIVRLNEKVTKDPCRKLVDAETAKCLLAALYE